MDLDKGYSELANDPDRRRFTQDDLDKAYARGREDGYIEGQMDYTDSMSYGYDDTHD